MKYFCILLILFILILIYTYIKCNKKPIGDSRQLQFLMSYGKEGEAKQYEDQCDWSNPSYYSDMPKSTVYELKKNPNGKISAYKINDFENMI